MKEARAPRLRVLPGEALHFSPRLQVAVLLTASPVANFAPVRNTPRVPIHGVLMPACRARQYRCFAGVALPRLSTVIKSALLPHEEQRPVPGPTGEFRLDAGLIIFWNPRLVGDLDEPAETHALHRVLE
jgi:hypothetical protein